MTIFHLRDLASGKRRIIRCEEVKVFQVPQYEGLTTDDMLEFARNYSEVRSALPLEEREIHKLPRQYISNIVYTLVGEPFRIWVEERIAARNKKVSESNDILIDLDPDIARIVHASSSISGK